MGYTEYTPIGREEPWTMSGVVVCILVSGLFICMILGIVAAMKADVARMKKVDTRTVEQLKQDGYKDCLRRSNAIEVVYCKNYLN